MNDTTKEVPAPAPKDSKNHMWLNLAIGLLMLMSIGLLITEGLGITRYTEQGKLAAAKNAEASKAAEAPKAPEKKVEAPKAETPTPPAAPAVSKTEEATTPCPQEAKTAPAVVVNCCQQAVAPKPVHKPAPKKVVATTSPPKAEEKVVGNLDHIWVWKDPYATDADPKPCVIERGDGRGLPKYCSGVKKVVARNEGESFNTWQVRVGGGHRPTFIETYQQK